MNYNENVKIVAKGGRKIHALLQQSSRGDKLQVISRNGCHSIKGGNIIVEDTLDI